MVKGEKLSFFFFKREKEKNQPFQRQLKKLIPLRGFSTKKKGEI